MVHEKYCKPLLRWSVVRRRNDNLEATLRTLEISS